MIGLAGLETGIIDPAAEYYGEGYFPMGGVGLLILLARVISILTERSTNQVTPISFIMDWN